MNKAETEEDCYRQRKTQERGTKNIRRQNEDKIY